MHCVPGTSLQYSKAWLQKITRELDDVSDSVFSTLDESAKERLVFERFLFSSTTHSLAASSWKHVVGRLGESGNAELLGNSSEIVDLLALGGRPDAIKKAFSSVHCTTPTLVEIASCVPCYLLGTALQKVVDPSLFVMVGNIKTRLLLRIEGHKRNGTAKLNPSCLAVGAKIYLKEFHINYFQAGTILSNKPDCSWIDASLRHCILMGGYSRWKISTLLKNEAITSLLIDEYLLQINLLVRHCKQQMRKGKASSVDTYLRIKDIAFRDQIAFCPARITLDDFKTELAVRVPTLTNSTTTESSEEYSMSE